MSGFIVGGGKSDFLKVGGGKTVFFLFNMLWAYKSGPEYATRAGP